MAEAKSLGSEDSGRWGLRGRKLDYSELVGHLEVIRVFLSE